MGFLASLDAFPLEKRFDQVLLPLQLQLRLLQTPQPLLGFQPLPRALDQQEGACAASSSNVGGGFCGGGGILDGGVQGGEGGAETGGDGSSTFSKG